MTSGTPRSIARFNFRPRTSALRSAGYQKPKSIHWSALLKSEDGVSVVAGAKSLMGSGQVSQSSVPWAAYYGHTVRARENEYRQSDKQPEAAVTHPSIRLVSRVQLCYALRNSRHRKGAFG